MTDDEIRAQIALCTAGDGGPLSRACFDERHIDCGLLTRPAGVCNCLCHRQGAIAMTEAIWKAEERLGPEPA